MKSFSQWIHRQAVQRFWLLQGALLALLAIVLFLLAQGFGVLDLLSISLVFPGRYGNMKGLGP